MRRSEMNEFQLEKRNMFVKTLKTAGWHDLNFNQKFDAGLWVSPEASMEYTNQTMTLRLDLIFEEPRSILYLDSKEGKSLGLVFKCEDQLKPLLDTVTGMQDSIAPDNIKDKAEDLLAACSAMFKISESGDKLIPVRSKKSK